MIFFFAIVTPIVTAIVLKTSPKSEIPTFAENKNATLSSAQIETYIFSQKRPYFGQIEKRDNAISGNNTNDEPSTSYIYFSQDQLTESSIDADSVTPTQAATQWYAISDSDDLNNDESEDESEDETLSASPEQAESEQNDNFLNLAVGGEDPLASTSKSHDRVLSKTNSVGVLHENDIRVIRDFEVLAKTLFTKLLKCSDPNSSDSEKFAVNTVTLENEFYELVADYAHISSSGNLFQSEATELFTLTRSLFELLSYREAFRLRYGNEDLTDSGTNEETENTVSEIGLFGLKLVDFEIQLFNFFDADGGTKANHSERLESAKTRFNVLLDESQLLAARNVSHTGAFKKKIQILTEKLQLLDRKFSSISQTHMPAAENFTASARSDALPLSRVVDASIEQKIESLISGVEENLRLLDEILDQYYKGHDLMVDRFQLVKEGAETQLAQIVALNLPDNVHTSISDYIDTVWTKLICMESALSCALSELCETSQHGNGECVHLSLTTFGKEVEALYHKIEHLLLLVSSDNSGAEDTHDHDMRTLVEDYKFHLLSLKNINTFGWNGQPVLDEILVRIEQMEKNLENAENILSEVSSFEESGMDGGIPKSGAGSCDESFATSINLRLQDIEMGLNEALDPSTSTLESLRKDLDYYSDAFDSILHEINLAGSLCEVSSTTLIEKISNRLELIKGIFSEVTLQDEKIGDA
ncbi:hypothetical protein OXX79_002047 [Metschnikowia pulcherrima]